MTDCLQTWRMAARDPETMARIQADLVRAWPIRVAAQKETRGGVATEVVEPLRATGEALQRVKCPVAHRVILKTEQNWSGK